MPADNETTETVRREEPVGWTVIDESVRLRGELGLVPGRRSVERVVQDAGVGLGDSAGQQLLVNEWGFIGTPAEAALIRGRENLMGVIYKEAPGMLSFEGSAGAYFEGSTLVIQHVGVSPPPLGARPGQSGARLGPSEYQFPGGGEVVCRTHLVPAADSCNR